MYRGKITEAGLTGLLSLSACCQLAAAAMLYDGSRKLRLIFTHGQGGVGAAETKAV